MHTYDAVIIGGGLFGQVIARALEKQGREVLIIDAGKENAGSKPAACLMKPSWFTSMGKDVYEPSLELLDELYTVEDLKFDLIPKVLNMNSKIGTGTVHWINPKSILNGAFKMRAEVTAITDNNEVHYTDLDDGSKASVSADTVVVAAGIWTETLVKQYTQVGQMGAAFLYPDHKLHDGFIQPWAPFKQLVAFNRGDGLWVGDGTAIKHSNWTEEREMQSFYRCRDAVAKHVAAIGHAKTLLGIRPYAKAHKPCLIDQVRPGLWVASGGAKNGTVAAGHCAQVIRSQTS